MLGALTNPRWADAAHSGILLDTTWSGSPAEFLARPDDPNADGRAIYQSAAAGGYGAVAAYTPPVVAPPTVAQLRAYAQAKLDGLRATARAYALTGGVTVAADATTDTGVDLNGLQVWGTLNPIAATAFVQNDGGVVTLTGAQAVQLGQAVLVYAQSLFAALASAMTGITNGSIATTAAIDALSWPT